MTQLSHLAPTALPGRRYTFSPRFVLGSGTTSDKMLAPVDTATESWADYFTNNGWTTIQDSIDDGYTIWAEPSSSSTAVIEEKIDYETTLPATSIRFSWNEESLHGSTTVTPSISYSSDDVSYTTVSGASVFASNFRYVKYRLQIVGANDKSISLFSNLTANLSVKEEVDSGEVTVTSKDLGGFMVDFAKNFIDVSSITVSAKFVQDQDIFDPYYAFSDDPEPEWFGVYAFEHDSPVRTGGTVSWKVRGATRPDALETHDVKIQRGVVEFGASEDSETANISEVGATTSAFARLNGSLKCTAGMASGTGSKNCDDIGAGCLLTDTTTVTVDRETTGENSDYRVIPEVWEYTGAASGANEFIVRHHADITLSDSTAQVDTTIAGISDETACVPFICGVTSDNTTVDYSSMAIRARMIDVSGDKKVRLQRGDTTGDAVVSVAVVEFTGANWSVEMIDHTFATAGAEETETITDVSDWANAFIYGTWEQPYSGARLAETGCLIWSETSTTQVRFYIASSHGDAAGTSATAYVVKNAELSVQHLSTLDGETQVASGATSTDYTITAVTNTRRTALLGYSVVDTTGSSNYLQNLFGYRLTSTINVNFRRSESGNAADVAFQVIEFP